MEDEANIQTHFYVPVEQYEAFLAQCEYRPPSEYLKRFLADADVRAALALADADAVRINAATPQPRTQDMEC